MSDRTPFVETEALLAVMDDDEARLDELLERCTNVELTLLIINTRHLARRARAVREQRRAARPWPGTPEWTPR